MAEFTIFYSWQSDAPQGTNRKFIGKALREAIEKVTRNRRFPINYALPPSRDNETEVFKGLVNDLRRAIHAVYIYDLESAKEAIRLLDINCMNLIAAAAKNDWFAASSRRNLLDAKHLERKNGPESVIKSVITGPGPS